MWRQWDPLEKSTWNLPSGSVVLIIKSDRYCADKLKKLCFISFFHGCSDTQHVSNAFYRYSFQTAPIPPKSDTNLKTLVSKGVYSSWFICSPSLRLSPHLYLLGIGRLAEGIVLSGFCVLMWNIKSQQCLQVWVSWFAGACLRMQVLILATGKVINYMLLVVYVFFYTSHPQFVLLFPRNSTTKPVCLHLWRFLIFTSTILEIPSHRTKKKFVFSKK